MTPIPPAERRQLTVMMCDLVAWTALSQRLDVEDLAALIQSYRRRCGEIVAAHGGTIAQYVGDGVLAFFGYPSAHEDDAERALRAALAIVEAEHSTAGDSNVHVGIATGTVLVGDLSGAALAAAQHGAAAEVSAVGSALNLAARLQALAEAGMVVVADETQRLSRGLFAYRDLGRHRLKGIDTPVQAWQVLGERGVRSRFHALRAPALTPLVNRQAELARLRELWDAVRTGQGKAVVLTGEAGVGKSRLAEFVAGRVIGPQSLRLWYFCSPHQQGSPLAPVIRYLTFAAGLAPRDDNDTKWRKLHAFLPEPLRADSDTVALFADLLAIRVPGPTALPTMSPQRHKQRLLGVLVQLLEAFAARAPLLLVVEDLHWIDPSSDELIGMIVDRLPRHPILAILTGRPEFEAHWEDRTHLVQMPLGALQRHESLVMIGLVCGERALPAAAIEQIAQRSDGMPLFIEDLTRDLLDRSAKPAGAPALEIPATLTDALTARLDRLGSAKAVAQAGAVIGREFPVELLVRVADIPQQRLKVELARLISAGLIVGRRPAAVPVYSFRHALVRDAAYASLLRKAQTSLHARTAQVLEEEFPETAQVQPEVLAHHFEAAADTGNAVRWLIAAAKLSARRSGFAEAIAQLQHAQALLAGQASSEARTRLELRVQLTFGGIYAEFHGFSSAECARAYESALALCRRLGDAPEIFAVLSGIGAIEITRARFARCAALAEEMLARAERQPSAAPFTMGHLLRGGTLFLTGEFTEARNHLEQALRTYDQHQRSRRGQQVLLVQDQKATGLCFLALTLTVLGHLDSGLRAGEAGLAHAKALGGAHTINFSLCYLAAVHHIQRDAQSALARATQSLATAREQGFATWVGPSQIIAGASMIGGGAHAAALQQIDLGIAAYRGIQAATYQPFWLALHAQGLDAAGRPDAALATLDAALAASARSGERFYLAELQRHKGELLARLGNRADGERWLRDAIDVAQRQHARLFELRSATTLCRLLDGSRRSAAAHELLAPVLRCFVEGANAPDVLEAKALLDEEA